jgi:hypothetical protein
MRIARLTVFAVAVVLALWIPMQARAQVAVGISVQFGPPALPVYDQPICPGDGYIWTPGYWAYAEDDGYYWVPGTWVQAPVGMLWTPGYWAFQDDAYVWFPGYWGPEVGFYGGIDYGYGYTGIGYEGGYWGHGAFYYNRSVNNITNVHVTNVYNKTVVNNVTVNNVSYNGGPGGTNVRPTQAQMAAARARHTPPTAMQAQHEQAARADRSQFASVNHGKPGVAATARPGEFSAKGVVAAKAAAPYKAPPKSMGKAEEPNRPAAEPKPGPANPRAPVASPENPGKNANPNSREDRKRQQDMEKQQEKQNQRRQQQMEEQRQKQIEQQQREPEKTAKSEHGTPATGRAAQGAAAAAAAA